jgi:peptidyl-prolyl cis-trans isomerase SurA
MKRQLLTILTLLCASWAVEAKTVDRILAQVNDEIITLSELNREMAEARKELAAKFSGEQLEQAIQKTEALALDSLIQEKLLYQKALELGYNANIDNEVSSFIQKIMKANNLKDTDDLENALAQQRISLKDYRDQVRKRLMSDNLVSDYVRSRITVLTPEIEKYYKDHAADFTTPEEVTLSEIIISGGESDKESENRANDIYRRLQQGESFAALASQYSKGPTANKGGAIGIYLISKLKPESVSAIANLKEGDVSKPVKIAEGYLIYHIDSRKLATVRPLEEVRTQIRNRIYDQKFDPEITRYVNQLKEDAYIQILPEIK